MTDRSRAVLGDGSRQQNNEDDPARVENRTLFAGLDLPRQPTR
jgi:hypothetical protein